MKSVIKIVVLLFSLNCAAQITGEDEVYLNGGDRIMAQFNGGGFDKFYQYINKEFDFSTVTKPGKMIASFTIDSNGEIQNIKVIQFVDVATATEIIRVLKKAPKWIPATKNGKPISIDVNLPFDFKLSKKK